MEAPSPPNARRQPARSCGWIRAGRSGLGASLPQYLMCTGEILLRMIAIPRRAFGSKLLKRCLIGLNGQLKTLCPGLPLAQDAKGVAKVVLRHGPMERYALAGALFVAAR